MSNFRKLLYDKNINQKELAHMLDLSNQLVSTWVKGRRIPRLPEVVKLSEILNVSIEDIVLCFVEKAR